MNSKEILNVGSPGMGAKSHMVTTNLKRQYKNTIAFCLARRTHLLVPLKIIQMFRCVTGRVCSDRASSCALACCIYWHLGSEIALINLICTRRP